MPEEEEPRTAFKEALVLSAALALVQRGDAGASLNAACWALLGLTLAWWWPLKVRAAHLFLHPVVSHRENPVEGEPGYRASAQHRQTHGSISRPSRYPRSQKTPDNRGQKPRLAAAPNTLWIGTLGGSTPPHPHPLCLTHSSPSHSASSSGSFKGSDADPL